MELQGYIADLLHQHNCVIVPDFGGFVANYRPAVIEKSRKKIYPPSKAVLFNPQLLNNDGLLGNYVSQKEDMTYSDALDYIDTSVKQWRRSFDEGGRVEIGEIGFLYRENGRIHFEQSREVNLLLQAFGLKTIDFVLFKPQEQFQLKKTEIPVVTEKSEMLEPKIEEKVIYSVPKEEIVKEQVKVISEEERTEKSQLPFISLNQEEKIEQLAETQHERNDIIPIQRNMSLTVLKYVAAAAVVPIVFYSYWIPMETDAVETKSIQFSDFNPIHKQSRKLYEPRKSDFVKDEIEQPQDWEELTGNIDANIYNFELAEDLYIPILLSNGTGNFVVNEVDEAKLNASYHVISGCFSVKENANQLVNDLKKKGFAAAILDKSGNLHRVTAGGYDSRDAAEKGLEKLRNSGQSGWILKK